MTAETTVLRRRMPAAFGPAMGPRQVPAGITIDDTASHARSSLSAAFRVPAGQLAALLPEGFRLRGEPLLVLEWSYMREIEWLAGRGYNIAGAKIPVTFHGRSQSVDGMFFAVLWESLADPILTGREELGVPKLYAEIKDPRVFQGRQFHTASWLGFNFFEFEVSDIREEQASDRPIYSPGAGLLQWKYFPRTGLGNDTDVSCVTFTPAANPAMKVQRRSRASVAARFHKARWEDLPTMYHVVNALADFQLDNCVGCMLTESRGMKSLGDTVVVD